MKFYGVMSLLPWPRSYLGKILLVSFLGVHVPLIVLIVYLLATSGLSAEIVSPIVIVILLATLVGTGMTFAALYALLAPVRVASAAVRRYLADKTLPELTSPSSDEAGQLLADIQEGITRLDTALDIAVASGQQAALEKKDAFNVLSQLSHDLRTPLNAILGFSEVLQNELLGPMGDKAYKDYAGDIHRSGAGLLETVQGILELSQLESGRFEGTREDVDVVEHFAAAVARKHLEATRRGVELFLERPNALLVVQADARAIKQLVLNIISISLETTAKKGRIACALSTDGDDIVLVIADNGRGFSADDLPDTLAAKVEGLVAPEMAVPGGIGAKSKVSVPVLVANSLAGMLGATIQFANVERGGKLIKVRMPGREVSDRAMDSREPAFRKAS